MKQGCHNSWSQRVWHKCLGMGSGGFQPCWSYLVCQKYLSLLNWHSTAVNLPDNICSRWKVLNIAAGYSTNVTYSDQKIMYAAGMLEGTFSHQWVVSVNLSVCLSVCLSQLAVSVDHCLCLSICLYPSLCKLLMSGSETTTKLIPTFLPNLGRHRLQMTKVELSTSL